MTDTHNLWGYALALNAQPGVRQMANVQHIKGPDDMSNSTMQTFGSVHSAGNDA